MHSDKHTTHFFHLALLFVLGIFAVSSLQSQEIDITWKPKKEVNLRLPKSIRVYDGIGRLADRAPIRATYAEIDLTDKNLNIRSVGYQQHRETTLETAHKNSALLAINGGYFAADHSVSLIVQDGKLIAPGVAEIKGAFGLEEGKPEVVWTIPEKNGNAVQKLESLKKNQAREDWNPAQAVGGGPVLIKDGKVVLNYQAEGFGKSHDLRHPRTAVGYKDGTTLLLLVVDGRQEASVGVTLEELTQIMEERGAYEAVNLDGGGSSTMVVKDEVINVPTDISGGNRNSLRKNAGSLLISEAVSSVLDTVYQFDTEDDIYYESGIWKTSDQVNYYGNSPARRAQVHPDNKSYYQFSDIPGGWYQLSVWNPVNPEKGKQNEIRYLLQTKKGKYRMHIDQYAPANFAKWRILGDFFITAGDHLEIQGAKGDLFTVDAIRLTPIEKAPDLPVRGDFRFAVISDLNSGLGATDYEWQVDSIVRRIPRFWDPDLILSGGDMVAGMGVSDTVKLRNMWKAFQRDVFQPLTQPGIPFAFTLGNHDAHDAHPTEKKFARQFWAGKSKQTRLHFIDKNHFPYYYSFSIDGNFFISWDASSGHISPENLEWTKKQLQSKEAQKAKSRFVLGHMPLYAVAKERDGKGDLLKDPDQLRKLLEKYKVKAYISGHQHAYYPGKRGKLELLNAGAAGSGPRSLLGENTPETNTITIVDLFYDTGKMVYTTYAIKDKKAQNMRVLKISELPSSIFSEQGYIMRRDVNTKLEKVEGRFKNFDAADNTVDDVEEGVVSARIIGEKKIEVQGWFTLKGEKQKFTKKDTVQLLSGKNTEKSQVVGWFKTPQKRKRKYRFKGEFEVDGLPNELFAAGALAVKIKTEQGVILTRLYPKHNRAPEAAEITSHSAKNHYGIRDTDALYTFQWTAADDPDGDKVSYRYELATDSLFKNPLLTFDTGRKTEVKLKESDLYAFVKEYPEGEPHRFFQRVTSSDGSHITYPASSSLYLEKSNQPILGPMEIEAPDYRLVKHIAAGARGYGATWDKEGKLWLADYYNGLIVLDKELNPIESSPLTEVMWKGETIKLSPVTGLSRDGEGNILAAINRRLIKIDATTGKPLAVWEVPGENRAITTPQVSDAGEIYVTSLFAEDDNYVLQQDKDDPGTFQLLRKIELPGRNLSRAFAMTADAATLYLPDPGIGKIQVYTTQNGKDYQQQPSISTENGGSSALRVLPDKSLLMAARTNGISPSGFRYDNPSEGRVWNLELPELNGAEPRGIGVSPDQKMLIFCSWDKKGGYYIYKLKDNR